MFENGRKYFDMGDYGESGFSSWLATSWFMVLGFLVGQIVVTIGLAIFASEILSSQQINSEGPDIATLLLSTGGLLLGIVLSIPALINIRNNSAFKPWGLVLLIAVILGFGSLITLSVAGTTAESSEFTSKIMGHSAFTFGTLLLSFVFPLIFLLLGSQLFHNRTAASVVTAWRKIRWGRIIAAAMITVFVLGVFTAIFHFSGISKVQLMFGEYPMSRFIGFALMSLLLIPFQSAAEELVFRGYLNQAFKRFIPNIWVVFIITSILFASMHLSNPESLSSAEKGAFTHILMMSGYFLFGFILCVIAYFEGGLEAVIGVHAANNIFAAVFVNYEGSVLPTPSVFLAPAPDGSSNISIIIVLSLIALALFFTRKRHMDFSADAITLKPGPEAFT